MKTILALLKKECARMFMDKRMLLTLILPGVIIFAIYSLMGVIMTNINNSSDDYTPTAVVVNMPVEFSESMSQVYELKEGTVDDGKALVESGELDVVIVFPENFFANIGTSPAPNVEIYYNSSSSNSMTGYNIINALLTQLMEQSFTINKVVSADSIYDLATPEDFTTLMISSIVPMLLFCLLASVCMSIAPESIAGEKERGTLAKVLLTPVKRWQIALGKIVSLTIFALISGIVSFLGVILSLPTLVGGAMGSISLTLSYGVGDYFALFGIILSLVMVFISIFSIMSAIAKSVKEATSYSSPLMIIIILFGLMSMIITGTPAIGLYFIPIVGSSLALTSILTFVATPLAVAFAIISNLIFAAILITILALIFNNEKIMFNS